MLATLTSPNASRSPSTVSDRCFSVCPHTTQILPHSAACWHSLVLSIRTQHACTCRCLRFHCLRPGISNSVNFLANNDWHPLIAERPPVPQWGVGYTVGLFVNPGVNHRLSAGGPDQTACKCWEVHQSLVFDFLRGAGVFFPFGSLCDQVAQAFMNSRILGRRSASGSKSLILAAQAKQEQKLLHKNK